MKTTPAIARYSSAARRLGTFTAVVLALLLTVQGVAQDHSAHEHHAEGAAHEITPEMLAVLRERIPLYLEYNTQQIQLEMQMMGPNEVRYLSADSLKGDTGVLVLIHGFGETGNRIMQESVQPLAAIFPIAMGAGMAMMSAGHIQQAMDDIAAAGAEKVIVVPMAASERNTLIYQWQHALGMREDGAFLDVPTVQTDLQVVMTKPPAGHPLIREILLDHAQEISSDPGNETVFIIAHGPVHDEENRLQLEALERDAKWLRERGKFSAVHGVTLQDDAASAVRAANVEKLRSDIETTRAAGRDVLIISTLMTARSIQWKIERDLEGLDYRFSDKGISNHRQFTSWFRETVMNAINES